MCSTVAGDDTRRPSRRSSRPCEAGHGRGRLDNPLHEQVLRVGALWSKASPLPEPRPPRCGTRELFGPGPVSAGAAARVGMTKLRESA